MKIEDQCLSICTDNGETFSLRLLQLLCSALERVCVSDVNEAEVHMIHKDLRLLQSR